MGSIFKIYSSTTSPIFNFFVNISETNSYRYTVLIIISFLLEALISAYNGLEMILVLTINLNVMYRLSINSLKVMLDVSI